MVSREHGRAHKGHLPPLLAGAAVRSQLLVRCALFASALGFVLALAMIPGMLPAPSAASAAGHPAAPLDAGLAKVSSVQGVMVFDPPFEPSGRRPQYALFAATSAGDRLADVRFVPDWAGALKQYQLQLAGLRKMKASYSEARYKSALKDLESYRLVTTREVWIVSSRDHRLYQEDYASDAATRRLVLVRCYVLSSAGLHNLIGRVHADRVWQLSAQLQSMMEAGRRVAVGQTAYLGRSASLVAVSAANDSPGFNAIVDSQSGLTLAVRISSAGQALDFPAFHVQRLEINRPLKATIFSGRPDTTGSSTRGRRAVTVKVKDLTAGSQSIHVFSTGDLQRAVSGTEVVPAVLPVGYHLTRISRFEHDPGSPAMFLYQRGMSEFVVTSGRRIPGMADGPTPAPRIAAFDRNTWSDMSWSVAYATAQSNEFVRIRGGALDGKPAAIFTGLGEPAYLQGWSDTREATIVGDLTRHDLLAVAGSLRPLKSGVWGRTGADLISLWGLAAVALIAGVTVAMWLGRLRRYDLSPLLQIGTLAWPLIGLALLIAGAGLNWHALLHNGSGYASRGWSEPLGRWVIVLAVLAVVAAAWRQLARRWRAPIGPKFLAVLLAMAALSGTVLAVVYLPLEARFTVSPASGAGSEGWLTQTFSSSVNPSATIGLFVSIFGALLLLVGVIMLRKPQVAEGVADAAPAPPDNLPA